MRLINRSFLIDQLVRGWFNQKHRKPRAADPVWFRDHVGRCESCQRELHQWVKFHFNAVT